MNDHLSFEVGRPSQILKFSNSHFQDWAMKQFPPGTDHIFQLPEEVQAAVKKVEYRGCSTGE